MFAVVSSTSIDATLNVLARVAISQNKMPNLEQVHVEPEFILLDPLVSHEQCYPEFDF